MRDAMRPGHVIAVLVAALLGVLAYVLTRNAQTYLPRPRVDLPVADEASLHVTGAEQQELPPLDLDGHWRGTCLARAPRWVDIDVKLQFRHRADGSLDGMLTLETDRRYARGSVHAETIGSRLIIWSGMLSRDQPRSAAVIELYANILPTRLVGILRPATHEVDAMFPTVTQSSTSAWPWSLGFGCTLVLHRERT